MSIIISLFVLGISLSMDTFSISLSFGTFNISQKKAIYLSCLIGIMHFLMPIFGFFLGDKIIIYLKINVDFLLGIILLFITIKMIIDLFHKEENFSFNFTIFNMLLLSIMVSLDSFSTGIGLSAITNNYLLASFIFSICATIFTFSGYLIGKYTTERLGIYAQILGIILLIIISFNHLF